MAASLIFGKSSTADNLPDGSYKLLDTEAIRGFFLEGQTTAKVIVNLTQPVAAQELRKLGDKGVQNQLKSLVNGIQNQVILSLDAKEVQIERRFSYIIAFSAAVTEKGLQDLINHPQVSSIEPDRVLQAHLVQGIPLINASTVRNTYNGSGLAIAICDTGIDYNHTMLGGPGFPNSKVIGGYDTGDNDANPMDEQGHGTACAGIAAGTLDSNGDYIGGVAYDAKLYAVKIATGDTGSAMTSAMIDGWEWCITHQNDNPAYPIKIISTSFGGGRYYGTLNCDSDTPAMTAAALNAVAAGITIFASSGNDGYCDSMGWPACISHVNSVGAVYDVDFGAYLPCINAASCAPSKQPTGGCTSGYYATDNTAPDLVTSYSNTASFLTLLASSNRAYTLGLSGTYNSTFGGTSAACPYAAGAAASLQSAAMSLNGAHLTPAQVRSILASTGNLITDGKVAITKPRINLGNAVASLTMPGAFDKTSPGNGVSNQPTGLTLTWGGSAGATGYEYCYDTTNDNACSAWTSNGTSTSVSLSGLADGTTYYWQVRAMNAGGTTYGQGSGTAFWAFTTSVNPPASFNKTRPVDGAASQSTSPALTWGGSAGATGYEYCYDTTNDNACDSGSWASTGTNTHVGLSGLNPGTTYSWQIRARNSAGPIDADGGTWWCFTTSAAVTAPMATTDAASGITSKEATLNGAVNPNNGSAMVTFQYGLSPAYGSTVTADQSPVTGNINTPVSKVITGLSAYTTYHYRVVAANSAGTTNGEDQAFKTLAAPPIGGLIYLPLIFMFDQ
jgi:subtilisin family serine protease